MDFPDSILLNCVLEYSVLDPNLWSFGGKNWFPYQRVGKITFEHCKEGISLTDEQKADSNYCRAIKGAKSRVRKIPQRNAWKGVCNEKGSWRKEQEPTDVDDAVELQSCTWNE